MKRKSFLVINILWFFLPSVVFAESSITNLPSSVKKWATEHSMRSVVISDISSQSCKDEFPMSHYLVGDDINGDGENDYAYVFLSESSSEWSLVVFNSPLKKKAIPTLLTAIPGPNVQLGAKDKIISACECGTDGCLMFECDWQKYIPYDLEPMGIE